MTLAQASSSLVSRHAVRTSCPRLRSNPAKALVPLRLAPRELPYPVSTLRAHPDASAIIIDDCHDGEAGRREKPVGELKRAFMVLVLPSWSPGGCETPGRETRWIPAPAESGCGARSKPLQKGRESLAGRREVENR